MRGIALVALVMALAPVASRAAETAPKPVAAATPKSAKPKPKPRAGNPVAGTPGVRVVSKPAVSGNPRRTLVFDPMEIQGRIQKPKAIHLLERSRTSFGTLDSEEDFLPKVMDSVEGEPF